MDTQWLALIGTAALGVYLYCLYREKRDTAAVREAFQDDEPAGDWRREALAGALEDLCEAGDGPETVYVFLNETRRECRWSCNAFRLDGDVELCTIAEGGVTKLAAHLRRYGSLDGMADAILRAYREKHGGL